ncbi:MAG: RecX family transcriptional regulator [Muribaculaceae bacterium]|nr:RecX family transcriptional regulator [Muribaculaceae bacterium]
MIRKAPLTIENALSRAAALCAKCEQCSPDIEKKLLNWGLSGNDAGKVITELKRLRFLDDERFAKAYAHDKLHFSGWGKRKIMQGLWVKRLPRDIIDMAFDEFDDDEYKAIAVKVIKSKVPAIKEGIESYEGKMKLLRFAVQRGFEVSLVSGIVKQLNSDDER